MIDVALAIEALIPAAGYGGSTTANTRACFTALRWEDSRKKPTWKELGTAWATLEPTLPDPEDEIKITERIARNERDLAVQQLKNEGKLPSDFKVISG